jgi:hypothetical protein
MRPVLFIAVLFAALPAFAQVEIMAEPTRQAAACPCGAECLCGPSCQCEGCPHRAVAAVAPFEMRPGYGMSFVTAGDCVGCPGAKEQALASGVPVEVLDVDKDGREILRLWLGSTKELGTPAYILTFNGEPVARWVGAKDAEELRRMAAYVPRYGRPVADASSAGATVKRGTAVAPAVLQEIARTLRPGERLLSVDGVPVEKLPAAAPAVAERAMRWAEPVGRAPGSHRHKCDSCGMVWEHGGQSPNPVSHNCPNCGKYENRVYSGQDLAFHAPRRVVSRVGCVGCGR